MGASIAVTRRVAAAVIASAGVLAAGAVTAGDAAATTLPLPQGKAIKASNADFQAQCGFDVAGVNSADYSANSNISAQAGPTTLGGYFNNVFTAVRCLVLDPAGNVLAQFDPSVNGSIMLQQRTSVTLPYQPNYVLCMSAYVKLRNGADSVIGTQCTG